MLDVGCGPSIANVISAAKWSRNVVMADVLESNRSEIKKFLATKSTDPNRESDEAWFSEASAFDWSHYFTFVSALERGTEEPDPKTEVLIQN